MKVRNDKEPSMINPTKQLNLPLSANNEPVRSVIMKFESQKGMATSYLKIKTKKRNNTCAHFINFIDRLRLLYIHLS